MIRNALTEYIAAVFTEAQAKQYAIAASPDVYCVVGYCHARQACFVELWECDPAPDGAKPEFERYADNPNR